MTPGLAAWTASGRAHPDDGTKDEREISRWRQLGQRKHLLQELWFSIIHSPVRYIDFVCS